MSADRSHSDDAFNFEDEMKHLAKEAQGRASGGGASKAEIVQAVAQLVRPLALEIEGIKRSNHELGLLLTALHKGLGTQPSTAPALDSISQQLTRMGNVESANQKLFDALHGELKGYKDNFLFDALQKPFIRDLVSLFDDFSSVHEQLESRVRTLRAAQPDGGDEITFLEAQAGNMENQIHHMIEVFLRMEVELTKTPVGVPVDKRSHRIVAFEPAGSEGEDNQVARSIKPGFTWRERAIRPEEIVARRWKNPASATPSASSPATPRTPSFAPAS